MAPKFGLRMNWKKQQRSNLSDTDPSNIDTSLNWQSSRDIIKYLQLGVVMGVAWACCSVCNRLIPLMGPKVPG